MKVYVQRCLFLRPGLVILGLAAASGCDDKKEDPAIDWDSPRMRAIEGEWSSLHVAYSKEDSGGVGGKELYFRLVVSVDRRFQTSLSERSLRDLAASPKMPIPDGYDLENFGRVPPALQDQVRLADQQPRVEGLKGEFVHDLLAFMVKAFVESGDRESLVELLSKRCPSRIEWPELIEFYLANRGWRFKDPMLILGEAYARCRAPKTRHALAAALRRSFAGLGIRGKDDAEFVDAALRWYENEKDNLVVSSIYYMNESAPGGIRLMDSYEKNPDLYDNPPPKREPLFKRRIVPKNLGEDPDR